MKTLLTLEVDYDPSVTDPEGLATAMDRLMETACSTPDILDDYANPAIGEFLVAAPVIDSVAAGPQQVVTVATRRYILYDFDTNDLATTYVYDSHNEAADDASQLDNVMILAFDLETVEPSGRGLGDTGEEQPSYSLSIDGPTFRAQRELLLKLQGFASGGIPYVPAPGNLELLEGLIALTDALADQAHDNYGVDCLLEEADQPCECEKPGHFCSGVPGILAHMEDGLLAPGAKVERCDCCQRYASDEAAMTKLRELGHGPP